MDIIAYFLGLVLQLCPVLAKQTPVIRASTNISCFFIICDCVTAGLGGSREVEGGGRGGGGGR